jgi:4-hydroxybenzoyl-CoA thioesterase
MSAFIKEMPIRFGDVDQARMLYYPKFYHLFHQVFEDMFPARLGRHYSEVLHEDNIGFPAVHQDTDYKERVTYGMTVNIEISCESIGYKSLVLNYLLKDAKNKKICTTCRMTLVCMNMTSFHSTRIPEAYRQMFEDLKDDT